MYRLFLVDFFSGERIESALALMAIRAVIKSRSDKFKGGCPKFPCQTLYIYGKVLVDQ